MKSDTDKESFANVISGKTVLKSDVIDLLLKIIQAMTVSNEINMDEFEAANVNLNLDGEKAKEKNPPVSGSSGTQKGKTITGSKIVNNVL